MSSTQDILIPRGLLDVACAWQLTKAMHTWKLVVTPRCCHILLLNITTKGWLPWFKPFKVDVKPPKRNFWSHTRQFNLLSQGNLVPWGCSQGPPTQKHKWNATRFLTNPRGIQTWSFRLRIFCKCASKWSTIYTYQKYRNLWAENKFVVSIPRCKANNQQLGLYFLRPTKTLLQNLSFACWTVWKTSTNISKWWCIISSWWFHPPWKILVKLGIFPK